MTRLLAAFSLGLILLGSARADNWPQWRGPANDGICNEKNLPIEWSDTKNVALEAEDARRGRLHAGRLGRPHVPHQRRR